MFPAALEPSSSLVWEKTSNKWTVENYHCDKCYDWEPAHEYGYGSSDLIREIRNK